MAGAAPAGADLVVKGGEVEAEAEVAHDAGLVVGLEELIEGHGREDLLAVRQTQTRGRSIAHGPFLSAAA